MKSRMIKVNVRYPKDMESLEKKAVEVLVKILSNKLNQKTLDRVIEILHDDSINIRM